MKGGKLIGQGSYGCVFDPSLLCENETKRSENKVSKLLTKKDEKAEIAENKKIDKIDPQYKWHLKINKSCIPKIPEPSDNINECDMLSNRTLLEIRRQHNNIPKSKHDNSVLKPYRNIIQEHGGTSVSNYITKKLATFSNENSKHKHFINLFLQSENLLLGIKDLFEKDMCHFDIKTDNVVYNEKNKRFNYIDFGLTRKIDDVKNFPSLWRAYWVWPLDLWLCYKDHKTRYLDSNNFNALMKSIDMRFNGSFAHSVVDTFIKDGNPYSDCLDSITKISSYNDYIKTHGYAKFIRCVSESIDTFSLGILYMQMLVIFTNEKFNIGTCSLDTSLKYYNELKTIHDFINVMLTSNSLHRKRAPEIYEHFIKHVKPILLGKNRPTSIKNPQISPVILEAPSMLKSGVIVSGKKCPDGQILNPKTNRCVSQKGAIGKKLISKKNKRSAMINITSRLSKSSNNKTKKVCPAGKILNPKTNRCVNVNGAIGKKLV